jgi:hypothetical protein
MRFVPAVSQAADGAASQRVDGKLDFKIKAARATPNAGSGGASIFVVDRSSGAYLRRESDFLPS